MRLPANVVDGPVVLGLGAVHDEAAWAVQQRQIVAVLGGECPGVEPVPPRLRTAVEPERVPHRCQRGRREVDREDLAVAGRCASPRARAASARPMPRARAATRGAAPRSGSASPPVAPPYLDSLTDPFVRSSAYGGGRGTTQYRRSDGFRGNERPAARANRCRRGNSRNGARGHNGARRKRRHAYGLLQEGRGRRRGRDVRRGAARRAGSGGRGGGSEEERQRAPAEELRQGRRRHPQLRAHARVPRGRVLQRGEPRTASRPGRRRSSSSGSARTRTSTSRRSRRRSAARP